MSATLRDALTLAAVLAVTLVLAWIPRDVIGIKRPFLTPDRPELEAAEWFSIDPDGLYHVRRVDRALREGGVASSDPYLAFPEGALVPWPPYYDAVAAAALGPFVPEEEDARRAFLEHAVSSLPFVFGLGSALLAALIVWFAARASDRGARAAGALAAGATVALCRSSINYSVIGTGDHHAWVSFLDALLLGGFALALGRGALRARGAGAAWGAACGAVAGLMLGSWVAALLYVVNVQLVLGWLLFRRAREELPGAVTFGLAFHLAALAVILPAANGSPWPTWAVVNLSYFHPAWLLVGALVFVPPLLFGERGAARYPWIVGALLAALFGTLWLLRIGPARGVAEGFAWASRGDEFMALIQESAPLLGPRSGGIGQLLLALGFGVVLLPIAWFLLARVAFRERAGALLPFAVALPPLLIQALAQRRFADALAVPMAVALGWAVARYARGPRAVFVPAALALAVLAQYPSLDLARRQLTAPTATGARDDLYLGDRLLYEWIRRNTPETGDYAVLASWDRGHVIEWAADRPSVATNFGSYIGVESFRAPARFLLEEDPLRARALLKERRARYVLVPGSLPAEIPQLCAVVDPSLVNRYMVDLGRGPTPSPRWMGTMGARLLTDGVQLVAAEVPLRDRSPPLGFLRLVHVSPYRHPLLKKPGTNEPLPAGFVWEHVEGAAIAARGRPGELVRVVIDLRYGPGDYELSFRAQAECDVTGLARLWIPYVTEGSNGDGVVRRATWWIGSQSGPLTVSEAAVRGEELLQLP